MSERFKPYSERMPTRFELAFSFGVVLIVFLLGLLVLMGAFGISANFRIGVGLILLGYGLIRFWMLKTKYENLKRKEQGFSETTKEKDEKLRNF